MQESQWINWAYLDGFPRIKDLVQKFQVMGLHKVMEFSHNQNESAIHQSYTTLEVDMEDELLTWMTGKKILTASFQDFATLVGQDYEELKTREICGESSANARA